MIMLPKHIEERFYKVILSDISLDNFEEWLYADKELEKYLRIDDYLDLISLNFKKSGAKYELWNLLRKHIDIGEFETYKIFCLLREAQLKNDKLPYILIEFYDMYYKGYDFLLDLGLGIGLSIVVPSFAVETWEELTVEQQKDLLHGLSPKLDECIAQVINWLETNKIILTGKKNYNGYFEYDDFRTEEEMKSKIWETVAEAQTIIHSTNENTPLKKSINKQWWEFWK